MTKFLKFLPFVSLISLCFNSSGKSVDEQTAKIVGSHFLMSVNVPGVTSAADLVTAYTATAEVAGEKINDYYVFNISGSKGFVIIAADDIAIPMLAYSNEVSFDAANVNESAKFWLSGYQNQITAAIAARLPAAPGTAEQWSEYLAGVKKTAAKTTAVAPLLGTLAWDQYPGYNNLCPNGAGGRAVTGCVATAMAQVMKFWNWPTVGCGSHTYTPPGYAAQTADFGNTAYNWTGMPLSGTLAANSSNVELLMYHAGVSVDMQYGPASGTGSGSFVIALSTPVYNNAVRYINCAEYALKTYFHYSRSLTGISRVDGTGAPLYTDPAWTNIIEAELNAGRPVLYSGVEATGGGHCWVCDGWQSGTYTFHFNFGWSGTSNGYYSINNVAPSALGTGGGSGNFNSYQSIVIGIKPDSFPSATGNIKMLSHLNCTTNTPVQYMTGFSVTAKILNAGTSTFSGDFCAQVFDTLNNLQATIQTLPGNTITAADSSAVLTFTSTGGLTGLIPETYYYVRIMYRPAGSSTWSPVANNGTFINYNSFDMRNSYLFSSGLSMEMYDSLFLSTHARMIISGSPVSITTKIANVNTADFNGSISAVFINIATGVSYPVQVLTSQTLSASHFNTFTFSNSSLTLPGGNYVLAIQHQPGGSGTTYFTGSDYFQNPIYIHVQGGVGVPQTSIAADNIDIFPNPATNLLNINLNGNGVSEIRIVDMEGRIAQIIAPAASQSLISVPVNSLPAGMYVIELRSGNELITKKIVITK